MNTAIVASAVISAVATFLIFIFTWLNYRMYRKIQVGHEEERQRFEDLLQALVIATLLTAPSVQGPYTTNKQTFLSEYRGKTPIFKMN